MAKTREKTGTKDKTTHPASDHPSFDDPAVAEAFAALPPEARTRLLELRALIFEVAAATPGVGRLTEALRWGEPSYLTAETKSGTTVRIHWKQKRPDRCALYVHCQTSLVSEYRARHGDQLEYDGDRAVLFDVSKPLPRHPLTDCVRLALTYHQPR